MSNPFNRDKDSTLFVKILKSFYYEHLMGNSSYSYNVVHVTKIIKQMIKFGHIAKLVEKNNFTRKKRKGDVNNLESGYPTKRINYQNT